MSDAITISDELRALIVAKVQTHGQLNAAQIHLDLILAGNMTLTLPQLIQALPQISELKQEYNPFIGSMARWQIAPTSDTSLQS